MPPDKYLFVEYWGDDNGVSTTGSCEGAAMIDFPTYSYSSGSLDAPLIDLSRGMRGISPSLVGFFGYGNSHSGAMGGGVDSKLYVIESLPYTMTYNMGIVHSVDVNGNIVVEIKDHTYLLEPGKSWSQVIEKDSSQDCHLTFTSRVTNYGLLDEQQITTRSEERLGYLRRIGAVDAPHQLGWLDNKTLIFATRAGIRFYATSLLTQTQQWTTAAPILSMAISPDEHLLAAADINGAIQLWSTVSGQLLGKMELGPAGPWISLAFSPDGKTLASGSWDGIMQLWDVKARQAVGTPWITHAEQVQDIEYSSNGQWLISSAGENWSAQIWEIATGQSQPWSRECVAMALSSDSKKLACLETSIANGSPTLYIADAKTSEVLKLMTDPPKNLFDLAFSPDRKLLAGSSNSGRVELWDVTSGEIQGNWTLATGEWFDNVTSVVFSPDGTKLAACNRTGAYDWTVWVLDLKTNQSMQIAGIQ